MKKPDTTAARHSQLADARSRRVGYDVNAEPATNVKPAAVGQAETPQAPLMPMLTLEQLLQLMQCPHCSDLTRTWIDLTKKLYKVHKAHR